MPVTSGAPRDRAPDDNSAWTTYGWSDPLVLGVVAVALSVLHGFDGMLTRDTGVYAYAGQEVARGVLPYLEIWNRDGPVAHVVPALGAYLAPYAGVPTVLAQRVQFCLLSAAVVMTTAVVARRHHGSRAAGLVAGATVLSFQAMSIYATAGPREKTAMVLFAVLAVLAAQHRRWFTSGVLVALATLTIQTGFFSVLPAVVVLALVQRRRRMISLLRTILGGTVTLGLVVLGYALTGQVAALLDNYLLLNTEYTAGTPIVDRWAASWRTLEGGFGWSLPLFALGLVSVVALPVLELLRPSERRVLPPAAWAFAAATLGGVGWMMLDFDSWPDALSLVPLAALGISGVFVSVVRRASWRPWVAVALVLAAIASAGSFALSYRTGGLERQQASVDAVLDVLPDARVVSLDAPQALVLGGLTNPSRHQIFAAAMVKDMQVRVPGGLSGFLQALRRDERPELVAVGTRHAGGLGRRLRHQYVPVGTAPLWRWWARADLGATTISRLRDATAATSSPAFARRMREGRLPQVFCPRACPGQRALLPSTAARYLPARTIHSGTRFFKRGRVRAAR